MTERITLPSPEQVAARIEACREEMAALRKLYRAAKAATAAEVARRKRTSDAEAEAMPCR